MAFGRSRSGTLAAAVGRAMLFVFVLLFAGRGFAGSVGLTWDPVPDPAVTGYMVHHGPTAGNYVTSIDVGSATSYTVPNLTEGATYHFAVTAYDAARTQSGYSNDLPVTVPYAQPVADFSASTTSGTAPLAMNFINGSTGTITTHAWTFGDGTTSTAQSPAHTYSAAGVYTVGLTVTGPGGSSTKTKVDLMTVTASSDTSPPTTPASLTATASGTGTINLGWTASSDNVGVTGYRVERCQGATCTNYAQIATPTGTTFGDTGLIAGTAYRYRVRASDAAGNLGGYSPIATATTAAAADTSPPTTPASLTATASGTGTINLSWTASSDNVGVTGYRVERCQGASCTNYAQIATPTGTTFSDTGLTAGTTYRYRVRASDAAGNLGGYSPVATATTAAAADTSPPTTPASLTATASGTGTINLSWTASSDNVGVTGYRVERCQGASCTNYAQIATPSGTTFSDTALTAGTTYRYRVRASDAAGNLGGYSPVATATTGAAADTSPPTTPASLTATASGSGSVGVAWTASSDNVGVTGYRVERCQGATCTNYAQIATTSGTTFSDMGLNAGTTYRYRVRANDAAGNLSGYSPVATVTTTADTSPPTVPSSLTAAASGSSTVNLAWTASSDNVGVTEYRVERCQGASCTNYAYIGTSTKTTFSNTGLLAGTDYRYRVRAFDAAGNVSGYSSIASATTAPGTASISFVQVNYAVPQSPQATVSVKFSQAQTAGNLNVIVVGWNDSKASVTSVTDSNGNSYTRAVGPTILNKKLSQSIYYAKNIAAAAAGANTVTVKFKEPAVYADIRIVEYAGLDRVNPVDATAAGLGSGTLSSTGFLTTRNAKVLLFGANTVTAATLGAGAGYTVRTITSPDSDIVEDRVVTSIGRYNATAPLNGGYWVMQLVAFKAAP